MKFPVVKILVLVLAICAPLSRVSAQLTLNESHVPLEQLSVGDLDYQHFTNSHLYFTLTVTSNPTRMVHLLVTIDVNLANGSSYPSAASLTTQSFQVSSSQPRIITNLDLGKNASIKTQHFDYSQDAKDNLQKIALATGRLPAGTYTFTIAVQDDSSNVSASKVITLTLSNVSRLDLWSPPDGSTVSSFPMLQWSYDGDSVEVSVYAFHSGQGSKEEAASGVPQLDIRSGDPLLPIGSKSFQYPSSGVRPLDAGSSYVWKVTGLTSGAGGQGSNIYSEVWQFTVASDNGNQGGGRSVTLLELLLGTNTDILNQLLGGNLQLTGVITVDGVQLSAADVQRILADLAANPDKIIDITMVDE